jgi:phenylpropionate dioxygenase-like ring-hydroxylating dioxygenase large terminal subunit
MRHAEQVRLIDACLAQMAAGVTDMAESAPSPVARYLAPERLQRETETLFRRWPILIGFSSELARPGDFIAREAVGQPVLVVRQRDGSLRAFLNVCRHRGTRVVAEECGAGRRNFACPYHAWTYGLDGALLALPDAFGFPTVDKARQGLVPLPVAEGHGMVFARPTPGDPFSVDEFLGPALADDFAGFGFAGHAAWSWRVFPKAMNWKLFFDASLETYHLRYAHARTIAGMFCDNKGVFEWLGRHGRALLPKRSIESLRAAPRATWDIRQHGNVLYAVLPNTILLVEPDHAQMMQVFPEGPGRTLVRSCMLVPERPESEKAKAHWAKNEAIFYEALEEDFAMMESIQRGLASGANTQLTFGRYECLPAAFHRAVEAAIA